MTAKEAAFLRATGALKSATQLVVRRYTLDGPAAVPPLLAKDLERLAESLRVLELAEDRWKAEVRMETQNVLRRGAR